MLWFYNKIVMKILPQNRCFPPPYHNPTIKQCSHSLFLPPIKEIKAFQQLKSNFLLLLTLSMLIYLSSTLVNSNSKLVMKQGLYLGEGPQQRGRSIVAKAWNWEPRNLGPYSPPSFLPPLFQKIHLKKPNLFCESIQL